MTTEKLLQQITKGETIHNIVFEDNVSLDFKNVIAELIWNSFDVTIILLDIRLQTKTKNI